MPRRLFYMLLEASRGGGLSLFLDGRLVASLCSWA